MMKKLFTSLTLIIMMLCSTSAFAQLPLGAAATDFTVTDINGNTHNLQSYLDDGKVVVLDIFATWCGPCWSFHQTHALEDLWQQYGPGGTDQVVVMAIEGDFDTNLDCILGNSNCSTSTQGDWTDGISYPMVNLAVGQTLKTDYNIAYYPTVYAICPEGKVYEVGNPRPLSKFVSYLQSCDLESSLLSTSDVQCFENQDGSADIDVTAGATPLSYRWSDGSTSQDLTNANAGTYAVTVTDVNGVFTTLDNVVIEGPTAELLLDNSTSTQIDCFGAGNGSINVDATGGTAPYSYAWSTGQSNPSLPGLTPGSYNVVVTDNNGCVKTKTFDITEPSNIEYEITVKDEYCDQSDASITITASGGTGSLSYYLNGGINFSGQFKNLSAGDYNLLIKDDNNCEKEESRTLANIPAPAIEPVADIDFVCDEPTVTINTNLATGNPAFTTYQWTTPDGSIVSGNTSANPVVNQAGIYSVMVTDALTACFTNSVVTVFPDPNAPVADIANSGSINCLQNEVVIQGSGSNGGGFDISWNTADGNIVSGGSSLTPTVDAAGTYELVIAKNGGDCETKKSIKIEEDKAEPNLEYEPLHDINCLASTAALMTNVSHPRDVTYLWTLPDGSSSSDASVTATQGGQYDLVVLDEVNGCESRAVFQVSEDTEQPTVSLDAPMLTCDQSVATINAEVQSSTNSSYVWTTSDGFIISNTSSTAEVNIAGDYSLEVTNEDNGCVTTSTTTVTAEAGLPTALVAAPDAIQCDRRVVILDGSASSSGSDIQYEWTTVDGNIVGDNQSVNVEVDLGGTYILSVFNSAENCEAQFSVVVPDERILPQPEFSAQNQYLDVELANMTQDNYDYVTWDMGDGFVTNDDITEYSYSESGTYTICMTAGTDCGEQVKCRSITVEYQTRTKPYTTVANAPNEFGQQFLEKGSGAEQEGDKLEGVEIFPNPANQQFNIVSEHDIKAFSMMNASGTVVLSAQDVNAKGITILASEFDAGLYFVSYKTTQSTGIKKIQIIK